MPITISKEKATVVPMRRVSKISPHQFKRTSTAHTRWIATVPQDFTMEDVQKPELWSLVSASLLGVKPGDRVEVMPEDISFYAEFLVMETSSAGMRLVLLHHKNLAEDSPALAMPTDDYVISFKGPIMRFCVVRKSDQEIVRKGFMTKPEAENWLVEFVRNGSKAVA